MPQQAGPAFRSGTDVQPLFSDARPHRAMAGATPGGGVCSPRDSFRPGAAGPDRRLGTARDITPIGRRCASGIGRAGEPGLFASYASWDFQDDAPAAGGRSGYPRAAAPGRSRQTISCLAGQRLRTRGLYLGLAQTKLDPITSNYWRAGEFVRNADNRLDILAVWLSDDDF